MSFKRASNLGAAMSLSLLAVSSGALAAGADGSWAPARCSAGTLPPGSGHNFYVSPAVPTDPGSCPGGGCTFKTLNGALSSATGGDTIYVRGNAGLLPAEHIWHHHFTSPVLVTNYPGEQPAFDGSVGTQPPGDYQFVLDIWDDAFVYFQGLTIQSAGAFNPSSCRAAGAGGVKITGSHDLRFWNNTIQNTAAHGMSVNGYNISIIGNKVTQTVMRNKNGLCDNANQSHDSAIAVGPNTDVTPHVNSQNIDIINNDVHDNWGECILLSATDTGRVNGNRVFNCIQVDIYIDKAQNVTVARNWLDHWSTAYNFQGNPTDGVGLINENNEKTANDGYSLHNIEVSSNIIENTWRGIHFATNTSGVTGVPDTYSDFHFIFNDISHTVAQAIKVDPPSGPPFSGTNSVRQNIVYQTSTADWLYLAQWAGWDVCSGCNEQFRNYADIATVWTDPNGVNQNAYLVIPGSWVINTVVQSNEPIIPVNDYYCAQRRGHGTSTPGAHEYGW